MQGVKGCVCVWSGGGGGKAGWAGGVCTLRLCSSERERETWKERMKTETRKEKSGWGEESAGVKKRRGWWWGVEEVCVYGGGFTDFLGCSGKGEE